MTPPSLNHAGFATGAVLAAVSVVAGAFGAHGLEERLSAANLALWETAARYLMYCALGMMLAALAGAGRAVVGLLVSGGVVFSGTVFLLALGGPRWFGAVTPLGGLALIVGFLLLAWQVLRARS
ncbi:MAG: DUF423 domain-containing protein [Acidobacteriota bacterium]